MTVGAVIENRLNPDRVPTVLVAGSSRPFDHVAFRAARMVAATLIDNGFNLVTGNAPGVDKAVAASFCFEVKHRSQNVCDRYTQLCLPWYRRGSRWPFLRGYKGRECGVSLQRFQDWLEEARTRADAAIIIGGHGGTLTIANRFIDARLPVFPVPFTGGQSSTVFQEILRNLCDNPVPGLFKSQFLRLTIPWVAGTGALGDLLLGTLSKEPDIFISYRRAESEWVAARLQRDLAEQFGTRRVFKDTEHIAPGQKWSDEIEKSIGAARVGIVVIGADSIRRFSQENAATESDVFRREISALLKSGKRVLVVTMPAVPPPDQWQLTEDLAVLPQRQTLAITASGWDLALLQIIQTVQAILRNSADESRKPKAES
jgi:hypothetical protein